MPLASLAVEPTGCVPSRITLLVLAQVVMGVAFPGVGDGFCRVQKDGRMIFGLHLWDTCSYL